MDNAMLRILKELRSKCAFENAGFSNLEIGENGSKFKMHFPFEMPATTTELTDGIKEATRIYRESWMLPIIDDLILHEQGEKTLHQIAKDHCL